VTEVKINPSIATEIRSAYMWESGDATTDDAEVWQARLTLNQLGIPYASLRRGIPPEPDVMIEHERRQVGIEVTRIIQDAAQGLKRDGDRKAVLRAARKLFEQECTAPVLVHAAWFDAYQPNPKERLRDAHVLAQAALAIVPSSHGAVRIESGLTRVPLPPGLQAMSIVRFNGGQSGWFPFEIADYSALSGDHILQALERKAGKIPIYRQTCDELWMILVVGADGPGSWITLDRIPSINVLHPDIARVFVASMMLHGAIEIGAKVPEQSRFEVGS
jgi:hypothetical protein